MKIFIGATSYFVYTLAWASFEFVCDCFASHVQVYRGCLQAKESDPVAVSSRNIVPASMRGGLAMPASQASRPGRAFVSTGLFPIPARTNGEKEA